MHKNKDDTYRPEHFERLSEFEVRFLRICKSLDHVSADSLKKYGQFLKSGKGGR